MLGRRSLPPVPETFPQAAASDFALILKAVLPPTRAAIVAEKTESIVVYRGSLRSAFPKLVPVQLHVKVIKTKVGVCFELKGI